ncbi:MAG TPA: DUF488 domain-containing protein [Deinococcales bacterium]|nr:DUF488 domain-containing protein [Deinococcales bacterium]
MPEPVHLYTVGHSNVPLEEFLGLLEGAGIELLVDVRRYPGSRRYPHFGKDALPESLREVGIGYVHLPELGGRRPVQADSVNTVWRNASFQGYADYMETQEFADGIARLLELAVRQRVAIMCSEAVWWRCHRALIADLLKSRGHLVTHLVGGREQEHPYTSAARLVDGKLSYSAE